MNDIKEEIRFRVKRHKETGKLQLIGCPNCAREDDRFEIIDVSESEYRNLFPIYKELKNIKKLWN